VTRLDRAIIALYLVFATAIGVAMSRRAGSSVTEFFVGGRSLPWWSASTRGLMMLFVAVVCFWWIGIDMRPSRTSMGQVPGVAS